MKLKMNKACDLASISVLPPRRTSGGSASQHRSQTMSQQSFSQGGGGNGASFSQGGGGNGASFSQGGGGASFSQGGNGASFSQGGGGASFSQGGGGASFSQGGGGASFSQGGGGASFSQGGGVGRESFSQGGGGASFSQGGGGGASFSQGAGGGSTSLLHAQSQLSQASLDENLLSFHLHSPTHDQRSGLHDDSSKRVPSFPAIAGSCARDESQLQLAKLSSNPMHRWNPSLPESRCQVPSEDVERKFQHLASSVNKMGMGLDSLQNDVMQLNRAMKEATLDYGSMRQKLVLLENSLQQILKGQDDIKALLECGRKGNPDHLRLNSDTSILNEISSILAVLPNQVQADLRQLKSDILKTFTKEMEVVGRTIKSLSNKPAVRETLSCTTNRKPLMQQTPIATGSPLMNQRPVANGRPQMNQIPEANGRRQINQTPIAYRRPQMNQIQEAKGRSLMNKIPITQVNVEDPKSIKMEQGKVRAAAQKLVGSRHCRLAPKQEAVAIPRENPLVPTKKAPMSVIIDLDDDDGGGDSNARASCLVLRTDTCVAELGKEDAAVGEEAMRILRMARKRRRRETMSIVPA